jgi:PBP1b-binding outer membrane lipoprotein LpoB
MKRIIWILLIMACLGGCATAPKSFTSDGKEGFAQTNVIPPDFKLVLIYNAAIAAAERDYKSWSLTISADGKAVQVSTRSWKEKNQENIIKYYSLSHKVMKKIISIIKESMFFSIASEISSPDSVNVDSPTFSIEVTMDGRSNKEVMTDSPNEETYETYGFGLVLSTVLKKVPSPNKNRELKNLKK